MGQRPIIELINLIQLISTKSMELQHTVALQWFVKSQDSRHKPISIVKWDWESEQTLSTTKEEAQIAAQSQKIATLDARNGRGLEKGQACTICKISQLTVLFGSLLLQGKPMPTSRKSEAALQFFLIKKIVVMDGDGFLSKVVLYVALDNQTKRMNGMDSEWWT